MHVVSKFLPAIRYGRGLISCLLVFALSTPGTAHSQTPAPMKQLTDWPGAENSPRISPNGELVAFDAAVDGNVDIYLVHLTTGEVTRVTSAPSTDRNPSWSPDGSRLAYLTDRRSFPGIWTVGVDGSDDRPLYLAEGVQFGGPDWSPDGTRVAMRQLSARGKGNMTWGRATILVIDMDGGGAQELTAGGDEWWPRWDDDSEWLYYYIGVTDALEAVHSRTREIRAISQGEYVGWRPIPSPDNRSLLFASGSVWIAPLDGSAIPRRLTDIGDDDAPSFSPDGKRVVFSSERSQSVIVRLDLETGIRDELHPNGKGPQELADGSIAFLTRGEDTWDLKLVDPTAGLTRTLTSSPTPIFEFVYSPGSDKIAVVGSGILDGRVGIQILDAEGQSTGIGTSNGNADNPKWCGDNRSLVFGSRGKWGDGFRQLWLLNSTDGSVIQLTDSNTHKRPIDCSADGNQVEYALIGRDSGIRTIANLGGVWMHVETHADRDVSESPDGSSLAFIDWQNGRPDIVVRDASGEDSRVTNDDLRESLPRWTQDGKSLLFTASSPNRDIWMLEVPELSW